MRNDARPVGEEFQDIAEHDVENGAKDRDPAEGPRTEKDAPAAATPPNDELSDSSER